MFGTVSHEMEVNVPASQAWQLYGTLQLAELTQQQLNHLVDKIELVQGDGGVGTVLHLIFPPDTPAFSSYKEKFTKVDDENRVKEAEVIEGGYLDLGFNLYRVRFEIMEKSENSCITRTTIEYDLKEEASANASIVSIHPLVMIMEAAAKKLVNNKN
ncbi:S-norcoclaurine synthase [Actinidia chinensis var. chinensis]|uniref:S-norcoclaurine synthase n=1 Tax=Actinidia chinensis var. chinensis TaxID=1590841 RepID=A0A2R6RQF8_ACTCC|nr:S-norcoclaurine synthase [Actinidia chinensis var. chinensis]